MNCSILARASSLVRLSILIPSMSTVTRWAMILVQERLARFSVERLRASAWDRDGRSADEEGHTLAPWTPEHQPVSRACTLAILRRCRSSPENCDSSHVRTMSAASPGPTTRSPKHRTFASLCSRLMRAV
jgi:hypothetical protein